MASVDKTAPRKVARMREVKAEVRARAEILATRARGFLAGHRETGRAKIVVTRGKVDSFVSLEDPNAFSIEWGREAGTTPTGRRYGAMQGLYIMHRTIGLR